MALTRIVREEFSKKLRLDHYPENNELIIDGVIERLSPYVRIDSHRTGSVNARFSETKTLGIPSLPGGRLALKHVVWRTEDVYTANIRAAFEYLEGVPKEDLDYVRKIITDAGLSPNTQH